MFTNPYATWAGWLQLSLKTALMLAQAQTVIGLRLLGAAGGWSLPRDEGQRMVAEKIAAGQAAAQAATRAAMAGAAPAAIAAAALAPVGRRTAANARRLARRGPALPG